MKSRFVLFAALGILLAAGFAFVRAGHPPAVQAQGGCSATLQGNYGLHLQGWMPSSNPNSALVPFAQVGLLTVDGAEIRLKVTSNVGGQIARDNFTYSYQVNEDCTGSMTPAPGIMAGPAEFVLANGGKQALIVVTLPQVGVVMSGEAVQQ